MERKINNGERELRCQLSDVRIEQREGEGGGDRTVTGYAAKFDKWSEPICGWFTEQIRAGAFDGCYTSDAIMCFNHNVDGILARTSSRTLTLTVDEVGLRFSFEAPNTSLGNDMVELLRRGDIDKCSFSFIVGQDEWIYADEKNGLKYDQRTILKVSKLYDVALVVYPAYPDTEASVRHLEERKAKFLRSRKTEGGEFGPDGVAPQGVESESDPNDVTPQGMVPDAMGTTRQSTPPPAPETENGPDGDADDAAPQGMGTTGAAPDDTAPDGGDTPDTEQPAEQVTEQPSDNGSASRRRTVECLKKKTQL